MIQELVKRYPVLDAVKDQIEEAYKILASEMMLGSFYFVINA